MCNDQWSTHLRDLSTANLSTAAPSSFVSLYAFDCFDLTFFVLDVVVIECCNKLPLASAICISTFHALLQCPLLLTNENALSCSNDDMSIS